MSESEESSGLEIAISKGAIMIDEPEWSVAFIVDENELFFNDWVPTGEKEIGTGWTCANLYDGKIIL